MVVKVFR
jgi:hypothetical protein